MLQIIFNEISAAELSHLPTLDQLRLLEEFKVEPKKLSGGDGTPFGTIESHGRRLYRYRAEDYRIYFAVDEGNVVVHRILHKNTLVDFLFRSRLKDSEDEALAGSRHFWKLIEEGENARRLS